jgi:diguanylate cyclase (GGDEF)-like protein/PAS domain S-box-containing protein
MDSSPNSRSDAAPLPTPVSLSADQQLQVISALVDHLDHVPVVTLERDVPGGVEVAHQNKLVQVRLGLASSLFVALRAKHAPTAAHCLRVALSSSCWSLLLEWDEGRRDPLEVAALLHDIGKIGVPDQVLLKPARLTSEEAAVIARHRAIGEQILLSCCASHEVLDIVKYAPAWYDGSRAGFDRRGEHLPLGARMVAILDAFDAMTTDQVYRRAFSHERAVAELFDHAGSQFDPQLVEQFHQFLAADQASLTARVSQRWLRELEGPESNAFWQWRPCAKSPLADFQNVDVLFHQRLLDSMHDGVIFVDNNLQILLWNRAAERMTGLTAESLLHHRWSPELIDLQDEEGVRIDTRNCPFIHALAARAQASRQLTLKGRGRERLNVDAQMVPVIGRDGVMHGATLLLHDASSRVTLEQRVQSLHLQATRDPLTNVANRSEFDRVHFEFVERHQQYGRPCALIICDIDHFKSVNDTYGHQAGDDVLIHFAALLQRSCRSGDLVARYGGEEFVVLCADCDNATVTNRAERIREELAQTPQSALDNRPITASFGVTEIQAGDTPETMLRRADRALLRAKESGRNQVVQLGTGIPQDPRRDRRWDWRRWFRPIPSHHLVEETLVTAVPLAVTMEKLRGFVSDHHAEIVATEDGKMRLQVTKCAVYRRRSADRPVSFILSLQFLEQRPGNARSRRQSASRTIIHVTIQLADNRDRRRDQGLDGARHLFASLKSYFMAQTFDGSWDPEHADANPAFFGRLLAIVARWGHTPVR